jgi:hypothetical protein
MKKKQSECSSFKGRKVKIMYIYLLNEETAVQYNIYKWTWQISESFFKDAFIMAEQL